MRRLQRGDVVPTMLAKIIADPDKTKAKRASDAMMKMVKIAHRICTTTS